MKSVFAFRRSYKAQITGDWKDRLVGFVFMTTLVLFTLACLYPILNVVAKAFSDKTEVAAGRVQGMWPVKPTTDSFAFVLNSPRFVKALENTVFVTVMHTALSLVLTTVVAYAVSKRDFPFGRIIMLAYLFTMMFDGGLIPTYFAIKEIGLYDSLWVIIIPNLVSAYHVVLMRNYIAGLPNELEESAMIDGASQLRYLVQIVVPLIMPSLATITLFCAVNGWNAYFSAVVYISSRNNVVLQVYLREVLISIQTTEMSTLGDTLLEGLPAESIQSACVVASALPIVVLYPFLQKYYVKGMTLGAVKG